MRRSIGSGERDRGLCAIPGDSISKGEDLRGTVRGLMAIGVSLGEALSPYAKRLGIAGTLALARDVSRSASECMRGIYEVSHEFANIHAFNSGCLYAGFHPACVGLGALVLDDSGGLSYAAVQSARDWIQRHKLDGWISGRIKPGGHLELDEGDLQRLSAPLTLVPCRVRMKECENCWVPFVEVESLDARECRELNLVGLKHVEGDLMLEYASRVVAPDLQEVGGALLAEGSSQITLSGLLRVGDWLDLHGASDFCAPRLSSAKGLNVNGAQRVALPCLAGGDER